jgi:tetratricopeptide (TPR) repeat protein
VIGYTRLTEGRSAEALASFRRILDVTTDPQSVESWQSRCLVAWIQATCAPELKMVYDPAAATEAALAAMSQTVFKEWLPYAVLAAAHAESGDFDKAVLRAQQALDQAPAEVRDECRARMETYKSRRTSRGARPPISFRKMP